MCLFPFLFFLLSIFSLLPQQFVAFFLLRSTLFASILLLIFDAIMPGDEGHRKRGKKQVKLPCRLFREEEKNLSFS